MLILWVKALHVIFMVTWFAGLFYLPRLFVYHAMSDDAVSLERFEIMERKLYFGIMTPGAVLTILFGFGLLYLNPIFFLQQGWMQAKLALVTLLVIYHVGCGKLLLDFKHGRNRHGHLWYRWYNEVPVFFLAVIVILVVVRPF